MRGNVLRCLVKCLFPDPIHGSGMRSRDWYPTNIQRIGCWSSSGRTSRNPVPQHWGLYNVPKQEFLSTTSLINTLNKYQYCFVVTKSQSWRHPTGHLVWTLFPWRAPVCHWLCFRRSSISSPCANHSFPNWDWVGTQTSGGRSSLSTGTILSWVELPNTAKS